MVRIVEAVETLQPNNLRGINYVCEILIKPNHTETGDEREDNESLASCLKRAWECLSPKNKESLGSRLKEAVKCLIPQEKLIDWKGIEEYVAHSLKQSNHGLYKDDDIIPYLRHTRWDGIIDALFYRQVVGEIPPGQQIWVHSRQLLIPAIVFDGIPIMDVVIVTQTPYFTKSILDFRNIRAELSRER